MNQSHTKATILLADDDAGIRTVVKTAFARAGYAVKATDKIHNLMNWIKVGEGDIVITDVIMPDGNGLDTVPDILRYRPDLKVVVISAQNTMMTALAAADKGAFEYLPKPFDLDELIAVVENALESAKAEGAIKPAKHADWQNLDDMPIIGRSPAMQDVYRTLARLMKTDLTVMIAGESGTGKELVARALHQFGPRRHKPFVAVNMAAIPRELIESEMFGHEKGAFTGAVSRTAGQFEQAEGGTLFLDEIGDMPFEAQTRLLRVLQEGEYTTVGGRRSNRADVRIIAATNRDLKEMIKLGRFREDLYYRLNVVPLDLPPLRERPEDIPELAERFLKQARQEGLPEKTISSAAITCLKRHSWGGNVRELENLVRRLTVTVAKDVIDADDIRNVLGVADSAAVNSFTKTTVKAENASFAEMAEQYIRQYFEAAGEDIDTGDIYARFVVELEKPLITVALEKTRGNQIKAAAMLGLNRNTLRKKINELKIPVVKPSK